MRRMGRLETERLGLAVVVVLALASGGLLLPNLVRALRPAPPLPIVPAVNPPPAAVLLTDERDRALQSVFILVTDTSAASRVSTAFIVDDRGDLLTTADAVQGAAALRLIDNTGGSHRVSLVGSDPALDLAVVRVPLGLPALIPSRQGPVPAVGTPAEILAPPKNGALPESTPATVAGAGWAVINGQGQQALELRADIHPAHSGAPVLGSGATLLGVIVLAGDSESLRGVALPIGSALPDLAAWKSRSGEVLPLATLPNDLVLRGDTGPVATPPATPSLKISAIAPTRAARGTSAVITVHGSGFVAGRNLAVHFVPVASQAGAFDGVKPAVVAPDTVTVTVPQGEAVQDYAIQLVNGDGSLAGPGPTFTVLP